MTNSLRVRLLWWLLLPLALYVFVTAKTEHDNARHTADLVQDNLLVASARMISGEVEWADGALVVDMPPAAIEVFASPYGDQVFYSVRLEDGRLLAGLPDFPSATGRVADPATEPQWFNATLRGQRVRAVSLVRLMYDNGATRRVACRFSWARRRARATRWWKPCGGRS
ncbi:hypothetical protein JCM10599A_14960 [Paraburkholderia kururiensis]